MEQNGLKEKIQNALQEKKPVMLSGLAQEFGVTEKEVAEALPYEMCSLVGGERFDEVWESMAAWEKATFIVQHMGHVIEIKCTIPQGKHSRGYYNLMGDNPLGGHIKADTIKHIAFLSVPFMGLESHSIQFFGENGAVCFSVYVVRENKVLIPSAKQAFLTAKENIK